MAQEQELRIDQGSRFQYVIAVTGLDLTGFTPIMQVKAGRNNLTVILDMSEFVTIDTVASQISIDMPGSATASTPWLTARYDILLVNADDPTKNVRILQGDINMDGAVSSNG